MRKRVPNFKEFDINENSVCQWLAKDRWFSLGFPVPQQENWPPR